ncbi:Asp-tRNA(Asn)/Glu-tRNA(Gln) amidotransferase subunit GatB [Elusimicrobiota bacterium]
MTPKIGLEIHVQLKTATKLFCSCSSAAFGTEPNLNICPVCMGYPGVLPVLNKKSVEKLVALATSVGCRINQTSIFARKNYFYPDLPKGYQISQFETPVSENGNLEIYSGNIKKSVRIKRVHLEEDAGKLLHAIGSEELDCSLVDFNRAGVPLAEVVTEPDIESAAQANDFLVTLKSLLRALDTSNCDMEKGELRVDVNISVSETQELGTKVEIKNLNSFKAARDAIEHETQRQSREIQSGGKVLHETRLWDVTSGKTQPLRSKEEASDYRYFPEPDLPHLKISDGWLDNITKNIPLTPNKKLESYQNDLKLTLKEAKAILFNEDPSVDKLFSDTLELAKKDDANIPPKKIANWTLNNLLGELNTANKTIDDARITPQRFYGFLSLIEKESLQSKVCKEIFSALLSNPDKEASVILEESGLGMKLSDDKLMEAIKTAIGDNQKAVADYKAGKEKALVAVMGAVMRITRGQISPQRVTELLKKELG